ncbi:hypothetical protein BD560DRAFT_435144 [Blakeslea trispora]|nr:hypothetical protein BD560DRAFT_435097 [Blakeslea trispora]KAI8369748.1 hypothetical protein BD560DRAFT_435144 [Blakeslea trispora]
MSPHPSSHKINNDCVREKQIVELALLVLSSFLFAGVSVAVKPSDCAGTRRWILIRAIFGSAALILFFYRLAYLTLLEATAIFFIGPIFELVIGGVVLNEGFST